MESLVDDTGALPPAPRIPTALSGHAPRFEPVGSRDEGSDPHRSALVPDADPFAQHMARVLRIKTAGRQHVLPSLGSTPDTCKLQGDPAPEDAEADDDVGEGKAGLRRGSQQSSKDGSPRSGDEGRGEDVPPRAESRARMKSAAPPRPSALPVLVEAGGGGRTHPRRITHSRHRRPRGGERRPRWGRNACRAPGQEKAGRFGRASSAPPAKRRW